MVVSFLTGAAVSVVVVIVSLLLLAHEAKKPMARRRVTEEISVRFMSVIIGPKTVQPLEKPQAIIVATQPTTPPL